jgi:long-subunit fatty acid transport protein
MKLKTLKYLFVILLIFNFANAQDDFTTGSPYSIFGLGDLEYFTSMRNDAMGIQGIGIYGNEVNNLNPAANTKLKYTNFSISAKYGFLKSTDGVTTNKISNGNVNGINIGIPFNQKNGWTLSLGFNPISQIEYVITNNGSIDGEDYTETYSGNGGLTRINIGMSYYIFKSISVGVEYDYSFGNITRLSVKDFSDDSIATASIKKENDLNGSFFKGGLVFDIGSMFNNKTLEDLHIGMFYRTKYKLTSSVDAIYGSSTGFDTNNLGDDDLDMPEAFGFGVSNKFGDRYIVSGDVYFQQWSQFKENGVTPSGMQNSVRYGLGLEVTPTSRKDRKFFENLYYRLGVFYDKSYFKVNNQNINRYGISAGLGIPINNYNSFDLGISYFVRGNTDNGLVKDEYLKLTAGFNFGELWFIKTREE